MSLVTSRTGVALSRRGFLYLSGVAAASVVSINRVMAQSSTPTAVTTGDGTFLSADAIHEIRVTFDQSEYDAMVQGYIDTADKAWIEATVSIDGAEYSKVGMRLKGNSSLMGLRSSPGATTETGEGQTGEATPAAEVRGGPGGGVSADEPQELPWLVRLDKYEDEQNHHGLTEMVIRANNSKTSLNEAVALDLLAAAGLASQRAASVAFTVNGGAPSLRLAIENPNDAWMAEHFSADGLLYKSDAQGDWSYRGEDFEAYAEAFDLEAGDTGDDAADWKPLIEFIDFLNNSDDEMFVADLPERLDIDEFAVYLAMMDLIRNDDDIDGPGNNSFLYSAPESGQFTVVPWDMNLAFGAMGGGLVRIEGEPPDGARGPFIPPTDGTPSAGTGPTVVINGTPIAGASTEQFDANTGEMRRGGPGGMENPLVKRFNADADFTAIVDAAKTSLRANLYENGVADSILAARVAVLESGALELVDQSTITSEAETLAAFFTES